MNRGVRVLLVLLVAIAMAGIASYAVYQGIQRIPAREVEVASQPVVVAAKALPVGALIGPGDVKLAAWPSKSMVAGAFAAIDDVAGRGLLAAVLENEPITTAKLAPREAGAGLAPTIPLGMRAVSVRVNDVIGVAGFVVPGSRVDVVATVNAGDSSITRTVVSNLQVLAAGTRVDQEEAKDGKPIPTTVVTLLTTPEDAERVTLASGEGQILLVLRNPLDIAPTTTAGVRLASLVGPPSPPPVEASFAGRRMVVAAPPAPPPPPPPPPYTVEAIRGAKRTTEEVKK
ncbi:MAG TPA: Flp pilus assembly protein CpaB [Vicinamibacterales bacterium]|nr:Flp pilus assembly protein CpaB [Vicinamibacterales bacterium]HOQ59536.1 Flp pilus assembly protein CpaB [Vicinamibacterales bacterium]